MDATDIDPVAGGFVLVTGGSRGIGAATARLVAEQGYDVCISYRDRADAAVAVVADIIEATGMRALAVRADVSKERDVLHLFATAHAELGRLMGLVNNAGVLDRQSTVADLQTERIQRILAVNVLGAFLCAREAVRTMSTADGGLGGAIVNVSSRAALLGGAGEYVDYAASKAAVDALTVGLSREVANIGIRVNAVRPGLIETEIHASGGEAGRVGRLGPTVPMGRGGTAQEVAEAIVWLLSDKASYVTGSFLEVSGGR
jgi:NAD(P)-dependent dehydrogenase (short-subunit alcohol dehydrogenase family)